MTSGPYAYVSNPMQLSMTLAFLAGLLCIGASFLKLGALADFLSRPILVGFMNGIALSIALVVPVVILEAIGSDYALHLRFSLAEEGPKAWRTVGRAITYAAITDMGAFLVFSFMDYGLLRQAALATVYVLACALVATTLIVPLCARRSELPAAAEVPA